MLPLHTCSWEPRALSLFLPTACSGFSGGVGPSSFGLLQLQAHPADDGPWEPGPWEPLEGKGFDAHTHYSTNVLAGQGSVSKPPASQALGWVCGVTLLPWPLLTFPCY